jgi:hypothetical protein
LTLSFQLHLRKKEEYDKQKRKKDEEGVRRRRRKMTMKKKNIRKWNRSSMFVVPKSNYVFPQLSDKQRNLLLRDIGLY